MQADFIPVASAKRINSSLCFKLGANDAATPRSNIRWRPTHRSPSCIGTEPNRDPDQRPLGLTSAESTTARRTALHACTADAAPFELPYLPRFDGTDPRCSAAAFFKDVQLHVPEFANPEECTEYLLREPAQKRAQVQPWPPQTEWPHFVLAL